MTPRKPKPPLTIAQAKRLAELAHQFASLMWSEGVTSAEESHVKEAIREKRNAAERSFTVYLSRLTIAAEQ